MNHFFFNDPPISEDDARAILGPYLDVMATCFKDGWGNWNQLIADPTGLGRPLTSRTRASFVNDHVLFLIRERLVPMSGIREFEHRGLRTIIIAERVMLRFKKLTRELSTSNIPTQQQQRFGYQLSLDGMEHLAPLIKLTAGYVLNRIMTDIGDLHVTCNLGKSLVWSFPVPLVAVPDMGTVFTIEPTSNDAVPVRTRRVRAKQSEQNDERQSGTE